MKERFARLGRRLETTGELLSWLARTRPWLLPVLIGLLLLAGLVSLAQVTHVAPFIYTLF